MKKNNGKNSKKLSRRKFISTTAKVVAGTAAFTIVPRHVLGGVGFKAPSDKLNIACCGVGGKGTSDIAAMATENIVALCDVDQTQHTRFLNWAKKYDHPDLIAMHGKANKYDDFRKMFDAEKDIDAVVISTPDHNHAIIAMTAIKNKKHVFCQKPLTHTVKEARLLAEAAKEYNVTTQMGNQGHAGEGARLMNEWIWDGAIGDVDEVHVWTNRPVWPQGNNVKKPEEFHPVPETMNWDAWLGPAPHRSYHRAYAPFNWRGWYDFGTGVVGDMGAHIIDHPYWALGLDAPTTISASATRSNDQTYPLATKIHFGFPKRGNKPAVKMTWYDGGLMPERPEDLEPGRKMGDSGGGGIFVGTKGKIMFSTYGNNPRIFPETKMKAYNKPKKTIKRSPGIAAEWIEACKKGEKSTTDFSYSGRLTETMLLGNVAFRMKDNNKILEWDTKKFEFTNAPDANHFLHKEYRYGWSL